MADPTIQFLRAHGIPLTRASYLYVEYLGQPPESTEEIIWPPEILRAERKADVKLLRAMGIKPCLL
jgi:hypothetical protein